MFFFVYAEKFHPYAHYVFIIANLLFLSCINCDMIVKKHMKGTTP